jgi:hypothetical protein
MIPVSEMKLYELLTTKFKVPDAAAKEAVAEATKVAEKVEMVIDDKIETRFRWFDEKSEARFKQFDEKSEARFKQFDEKSEARFKQFDEKIETRFAWFKDVFATKEDIRDLRVLIERNNATMLRWAFLFWVAQLSAAIAFIKYLK